METVRTRRFKQNTNPLTRTQIRQNPHESCLLPPRVWRLPRAPYLLTSTNLTNSKKDIQHVSIYGF